MAKAVIFDVDGTLVDSVDLHAQAWQDAFRAFGHDIDFLAIRNQIGKGGDHLMPVFLDPRELEEIGKPLEKRRAEILKDKYLPKVTAFPRVRELFERLNEDGLQVALASSAKRDELAVYKRVAKIDDLVHVDTSSDDAQSSKPDPDILQVAMSRLGDVASVDVVVIGDTPYDAEAAAKAGLQTIGMLCGGFPESSLRTAGCIAIYRDPADLLDYYDEPPLVEAKSK